MQLRGTLTRKTALFVRSWRLVMLSNGKIYAAAAARLPTIHDESRVLSKPRGSSVKGRGTLESRTDWKPPLSVSKPLHFFYIKQPTPEPSIY